MLGKHVQRHNPGIVTVATSKGKGPSTISLSPKAACARIRAGVERALNGNHPVSAYRMSWYPGCKHVGRRTIRLEARDYFEVARALMFIV